jgi:hypothetical protein
LTFGQGDSNRSSFWRAFFVVTCFGKSTFAIEGGEMTDAIIWSPGMTLESMEKQVILKAFRYFRGNKTQCAIALGIAIRTLENKLEKYEQDGEGQRIAEQREAEQRDAQLRRARGIVGQTIEQTGDRVLHRPDSGVRVEPSVEASAQHAVPLPQRQEIQSVLPKHASAGSKGRNR